MVPRLHMLVPLLCLVTEGCLLYTDPVNSSPTVQIAPPVGTVNRGQTVPIYAHASDPDGDAVTLEWSTAMHACQEPIDVSQRPATELKTGARDPFMVTFAADAPTTVCIFVLAVDAHGATAFDAHTLQSENRPPVADITVLEPTTRNTSNRYDLYSTFHLSAAMSRDPDGDTIKSPQFMLVGFPPAAMPTPTLGPCPGMTASDLVTCLSVGAFAGNYTVSLTVSDGFTTSMPPFTQVLTVDEDHPPCVKDTDPTVASSPIVLDPGLAKTFTVTEILDDGAPLPTPPTGANATPTFQWTIRRNGGTPTPVVGYDKLNALTLPAGTYATGDVVQVNVGISDGVAMHLQPQCDPGCPADCPQAAQWTVNYR